MASIKNVGTTKYKQYPEPTTGALIFNQKGEILLIKTHKWKNKYSIPGGHIELGESIEEALKREVKEETGLSIYDLSFINFREFIFGSEFWEKKHFIFFNFACRTDSLNVQLNAEGQEFIWTSLENIHSLPVEPYAANLIQEYKEKIA